MSSKISVSEGRGCGSGKAGGSGTPVGAREYWWLRFVTGPGTGGWWASVGRGTGSRFGACRDIFN